MSQARSDIHKSPSSKWHSGSIWNSWENAASPRALSTGYRSLEYSPQVVVNLAKHEKFNLAKSWKVIQFSSVAWSCPTFCNPINCSTPGLPVHHQLPEFIQTHFHQVGDAIQPSHPLLFPSPPAPNPSQHQSLFQWVNSSHEVAKVLEIQL